MQRPLYVLVMGHNDEHEDELARDARAALLRAITKDAESGDGAAAKQCAEAYEILKRSAPDAPTVGAQEDQVRKEKYPKELYVKNVPGEGGGRRLR